MNRRAAPRVRAIASILPLLIGLLLLTAAPAAQAAGGLNSPVLITTGQVIQSETSGDPIQVDTGSWLLFRNGFSVSNENAEVLETITLEIVLDGELLAVETVTEPLGDDATVLWGYASSPPLSPGSMHTVTYRGSASEAGEDGFGGSWEQGILFEFTGTIVAGGS